MRDIGFTGTRHGLTGKQMTALMGVMVKLRGPHVLHHGDCVGADAHAHREARKRGWSIVLHPPSDSRLRAFCDHDDRHPVKGYLDRNRNIVSESGLLLACPKEMEEQQRGGTWFTVRAAREAGVPVTIVYPDGTVVED